MSVRRLCALACLAVVAGAAGILAWRAGESERTPRQSPVVVMVLARAGTASAEKATGFAVGNGRVVTVAHVVAGSRAVAVVGQRGRHLRGRVLRTDPRLDLALLAVPGVRAPDVEPARSGGRARVLVVRGGRVSGLPAEIRRHVGIHLTDRVSDHVYDRPGLELGAQIDPGDSGAPVLASGRLAGVVFARSAAREGTAYAVDATALGRLVSSQP
jgi:S1-C subfamily serine protease